MPRGAAYQVCFGMKKVPGEGRHAWLPFFASAHLVSNYRIIGQLYMQPELCYTVADVFMALSGKRVNINKNRCSWLLETLAKCVRHNHFHLWLWGWNAMFEQYRTQVLCGKSENEINVFILRPHGIRVFFLDSKCTDTAFVSRERVCRSLMWDTFSDMTAYVFLQCCGALHKMNANYCK